MYELYSNMEHDEIVEKFKEITGICDNDFCVGLLKSCDWNLEKGIGMVSEPMDVPSFSTAPQSNTSPSLLPTESDNQLSVTGIGLSNEVINENRTRHQPYEICVHYCDGEFLFQMPQQATVAELKLRIEESTGVESRNQEIFGWPVPEIPTSTQRLDTLRLQEGSPNNLVLVGFQEGEEENGVKRTKEYGAENKDFVINFGEERLELTFPADQCVEDIKMTIQSVFGVLVEDQVLSGWPEGFDGSLRNRVRELPMSPEKIVLTLQRVEVDGHGESVEVESSFSFDSDLDHDVDVGEDAFSGDVGISASHYDKIPMIAESVRDEASGVVAFSSSFDYRYGPIHIPFFQGTLQEAIKEARQNAKFLFVYLHSDESLETPVFCSHVLCSEQLSTVIREHFIVWAWDVTLESQRTRALEFLKSRIDFEANFTPGFVPNRFPFVLLMGNVNGFSITVLEKRSGFLSVDDLILHCQNVVEEHKVDLYNIREQDLSKERERVAREDIKKQQDLAYRESLEADKRKAEERLKEEVAEKERLAAEERLKKEHEENIKRLAASIPEEPDASCTEKISKLMFRFPDGERLQRRFLASCKLEILFMFVESKGFARSEHELQINFPKRLLKNMKLDESLESNGLFPAETIFVQEN